VLQNSLSRRSLADYLADIYLADARVI